MDFSMLFDIDYISVRQARVDVFHSGCPILEQNPQDERPVAVGGLRAQRHRGGADSGSGRCAMAVTVVMPRIGTTMIEGTIVRWEKKPGDLVRQGEVIVRIETDFSEAEVTAPQEGYLLKIDADPEQIVACGEPIAWLGGQGEKV